MMKETILITGFSGCIGSSALRWLRENFEGEIVGIARKESDGPDRVFTGDITDPKFLNETIQDVRPTRIIHLAGFQTPDCQNRPFDGYGVNVEGTANLLRAAASLEKEHLQRVVFASSAAVYGPRSLYPGETVKEDAGLLPPNLYGHWKVAGEGIAQAFHLETDVPTVSLRLATTYGPGRDLGLTSAPTTAMKRAAAGEDFSMPYQGREHYHFVDDVGAAFAIAATADFSAYGVFNIRGFSMENSEFIKLIGSTASSLDFPESRLTTASDAKKMPFVCDLDETAICRAFPTMPKTETNEGVKRSLEFFRSLDS